MAPPRRYPLNERAFSTVTSESAYWIGMMMSDGNVSARGAVRLTLDYKDADHLRAFLAFIGSPDRPLLRHGPTGFAATVSSPPMVRDLARYGVVPAKTWADPAAPPEIVTRPGFWRGMLDGDGTLRPHIHKGVRRPAVQFMGSRRLMVQAAEMMKCNDHVPAIRAHGSVWVTSVTGFRAQALLRWLYSDAGPALERKRRKGRGVGRMAGSAHWASADSRVELSGRSGRAMTQPALFGETLCGYCGAALAPVGDGSWRCVDCAPELARIRTLEEWGFWMRRKLRKLRSRKIAGAEGTAPDAPVGRGVGSAADPRPPFPAEG